MSRGVRLLFFTIFFVCLSGMLRAQSVSNEGTDFWAVFPTHVPNSPSSLANISVFVTSKNATEVTVSCGAWSSTQSIAANEATQFLVPRSNAYVDLTESNKTLTNRGIHIKVTDGKPKVSAYAHIYAGARSAASLILPFETLGQNYYSMNYEQGITNPQGYNYITLVAVEDNTTLLLHDASGSVKTITLSKAGDVYEHMSGLADLTGSYVETDPATSSCKRFAAFSGTSTDIISCNSSQDPLYQQLYPTASWGKNYGVSPFADRRYILRIMAQENNTKVSFNGQTYTINKGAFIESPQLTEGTFVSADKLISVAQFALTQNCSSINGGSIIGDPDMVMLNPIEFNIKNVTVFSSTLQVIISRYINVLMRTDKTSTFKIDGVAPTGSWVTLAGNPSYSYIQIPITKITPPANFASLTLTADDGFNAIAYGFGNAESYAYSAGTNLSSNNYLTVVNDAKNEESSNGCVGQAIDFKVNLPYKPDKITWTLDGGTPDVSVNPVPEIKTVNGQTIYIYRYPVQKTYTTIGEYHLEVLAHVPNNESNCISGDLTTNYIFNIYKLPTAAFDATTATCAKTDAIFTDQSVSNSTEFSVTNWLWDFGDGTTSTDKNPKHQYANEGTFTVSLSSKSGAGCYSDPLRKTITIYPIPVSKFTSISNTCINTNYVLSDNSTVASGKIAKWHWDFGDGKTLDKTDGLAFNYQYTTVGTYHISLTTTSDQGCTGVIFTKDVVVTDLPVADFTTPDICLTDAYAVFANKSADAAGGNGTFTYEWNYGDANATTANPNTSAERDGKHRYINFGDYTVTLKITNSNGCVTTKTKLFKVNGGVDKALFTVQNENSLCSNADVVINNASSAFFGKITKIMIYKDFINDPATSITISSPGTEDVHLVYPVFGGAADKNYTVRLVAYSGETCFKEFLKVITLKPSPTLVFSDIPSVCQNGGSVLITQAKETSGILGAGVYSGDGIDESGNFNPKNVNIGLHNITYTFSSANGCSSSMTKSIEVFQSPVADAGPSLIILSGGEVVIPAVAQGDKLKFKWTPSAGLNHDDVLNPVASPDQTTDYLLTVSTENGCTVESKINITVLQNINPPNSFTPNGDGINDIWAIKYIESYPNATIEVFSRNGMRVFYSKGYKIPFDGNFQNEPLPVGVYYYIIDPKNQRKIVTGSLTLIR